MQLYAVYAPLLLNVLRHGGTGAGEIKPAAELIGDEGIVERLGQRQDFPEELFNRLRPELFMIAARGFGLESFAVPEPGGAEPIKLRAADLQTLEGGCAVH